MIRRQIALIIFLLTGTSAISQTMKKPIVESIRADGYLILTISTDLPLAGVRGNIYYEIVAEGISRKIIPAEFTIVEKLGKHRYLARVTSRNGQVNPGYLIEYQAPPPPAEPAVSLVPPAVSTPNQSHAASSSILVLNLL